MDTIRKIYGFDAQPALSSIIPVDTGLAKRDYAHDARTRRQMAVNAVRVPTLERPRYRLVVCRTERDVTVEQINQAIRSKRANSKYAGLMGFTKEAHASVDFNHESTIGDYCEQQTQVIDQRNGEVNCAG